MMGQIVYDEKDRSVRVLPEGNDTFRAPISGPLLFDTEAFHSYHSRFCDRVLCVSIVRDNRLLARCYVGVDDRGMRTPYSAPFSLIYPHVKWRIEDLCAAADGLLACARHLGCTRVWITLPPPFYSPEVIGAETAALGHAGFTVQVIEINHYFNLKEFDSVERFVPQLSRSGRKNYNRACDPDLQFESLGADGIEQAYAVIKTNREQTGYPLKLPLSHIKDLIGMVPSSIQCFGVRYCKELIAAAIVFDVTPTIARVIYWGDDREHQFRRPMSLLAMRLVELYSGLGRHFLDIGISSADGTINFGLANFKKSIGCRNSARLTLQHEL